MRLGLFFAATVAVGWALFTFVERPVMRRWARRRVPAPPAPALEST